MGQKLCSCCHSRPSRIASRKESNLTAKPQGLHNKINAPDAKSNLKIESTENTQEAVATTSYNASSFKQDFLTLESYEFKIEDDTLIMSPTREDVRWSTNPLSKKLSLKTPKNNTDVSKHELEIDNSETYHHELPYIPPKPACNLWLNDVNDNPTDTDPPSSELRRRQQSVMPR